MAGRPDPAGGSRRLVLPAAAVLLVAGCLLQILAGYSHPDLSGHAWGSDDAYISYRYARNLAAGEGLVFNPGERVEGYSNLLYVLLLAPAAALVAPERLYAVSTGLNTLFALAALVLLHRFTRRRLGSFEAAIVAGLFALCPSVWAAVASGLETPMVLLLQIGTWILAEQAVEEGGARERRTAAGLCIVAAVSVLARADGFITPLLAAVFLGLRGRWRPAFAVAASTLATFGALALFRLSYYGWPLPNTYYAKVDGPLLLRLDNGWQQLLTAVIGTGLLVYLVAFLMAGVRGLRSFAPRRPDPLPALPFPAVFAAGWLAYYLYIGGDVFYDRFLLFLFPMGTWLLLALLAQLARTMEAGRSRRRTAVLAVLLAVLQLVALSKDPRFQFRVPKYDRWVLLGRHLRQEPAGTLIAVDAAGKVPFFSGLPALDMLGLTDPHIGHGRAEDRAYFHVGHDKSDLPYILSRKPALIAIWLRGGWTQHTRGQDPLEQAGYSLDFVLNTTQDSKGRDLVDVRHAAPAEVRRLVAAGYQYGLFGRAPAQPGRATVSPRNLSNGS